MLLTERWWHFYKRPVLVVEETGQGVLFGRLLREIQLMADFLQVEIQHEVGEKLLGLIKRGQVQLLLQ